MDEITGDLDSFNGPLLDDDDTTHSRLSARHNSEMQGDLDFDAELEEELSVGMSVNLEDDKLFLQTPQDRHEVNAGRKSRLRIEALESQLRIIRAELSAEEVSCTTAEKNLEAVTKDRADILRLLEIEKVDRASDVAQRDATIEQLHLEVRKSQQYQVSFAYLPTCSSRG
jgi:hypothetical protein